jgi:hypothetical protein
MIRLVALDLVLGFLLARMVDIIHILGVNLHNPGADVPRLGVPGHVIADFECVRHDSSPGRDARPSRSEPLLRSNIVRIESCCGARLPFNNDWQGEHLDKRRIRLGERLFAIDFAEATTVGRMTKFAVSFPERTRTLRACGSSPNVRLKSVFLRRRTARPRMAPEGRFFIT